MMTIKHLFLLTISITSSSLSSLAFTAPHSSVKTTTMTTTTAFTRPTFLESQNNNDDGFGGASSMVKKKASSALDSVTETLASVDVSRLTGNFDKIYENIMDGKVGERGELYTLTPYGLVFCVLIGGIPLVGEPLFALMGPILSLSGVALILLALADLGPGLSPWPIVAQKNTDGLVTNGVYGLVRHPIYAGLIYTMLGISILSDSTTRLLLSALLIYAVNVKTTVEERDLVETFGSEYEQYRRDVPGKFVPHELMSLLPWTEK